MFYRALFISHICRIFIHRNFVPSDFSSMNFSLYSGFVLDSGHCLTNCAVKNCDSSNFILMSMSTFYGHSNRISGPEHCIRNFLECCFSAEHSSQASSTLDVSFTFIFISTSIVIFIVPFISTFLHFFFFPLSNFPAFPFTFSSTNFKRLLA